MKGKVLKMDRPAAGGFLGLTVFQAEGFGIALGHTFGVKVDGASPRGLWPPNGGRLCSLPLRGRRPFGPKVVVADDAASFKVSVTGFAFLCHKA